MSYLAHNYHYVRAKILENLKNVITILNVRKSLAVNLLYPVHLKMFMYTIILISVQEIPLVQKEKTVV